MRGCIRRQLRSVTAYAPPINQKQRILNISYRSSTMSTCTGVKSDTSDFQEPSTIFPMHVLGGGSIGILYASAIHCHYLETVEPRNIVQNPVTLLMRSHHKPHLIQRCVANESQEVISMNKSQWFASATVSTASNDNDSTTLVRQCNLPVGLIHTDDESRNSVQQDAIKTLLLCTKATDSIHALESVWDRLILPSSSPSKVIILSNGALAIRDAIHKHFGRYIACQDNPKSDWEKVQIILGTTTHGAYKQSSTNDGNIRTYDIVHAGHGSTHCTNQGFVEMCQSIGWESESLSELDMNVMLWKKLAVNCVINPLTAIHDVKNGQLLNFQHEGQDVKVVTRQLLEEVSSVAISEMELLFNETIANKEESANIDIAWLQSTREQLSVSSLETFVFKVMADTANNMSSMLQDVRAKRKTEVQFLNGYVTSVGQEKYGLNCPWNTEMSRLVEELR